MNIFTSKNAAKAIDRLDAKTHGMSAREAVEGIPKVIYKAARRLHEEAYDDSDSTVTEGTDN